MTTLNPDYLSLPFKSTYFKKTKVLDLNVGDLVSVVTFGNFEYKDCVEEIAYIVVKIEEVSEHFVITYNFFTILKISLVSIFIKNLFFGLISFPFGPKNERVVSFTGDGTDWENKITKLYTKEQEVICVKNFNEIKISLLPKKAFGGIYR